MLMSGKWLHTHSCTVLQIVCRVIVFFLNCTFFHWLQQRLPEMPSDVVFFYYLSQVAHVTFSFIISVQHKHAYLRIVQVLLLFIRVLWCVTIIGPALVAYFIVETDNVSYVRDALAGISLFSNIALLVIDQRHMLRNRLGTQVVQVQN